MKRLSRLAPFGVALVALVVAGCEDEREATTGPTGALDGDTIFGTALVSTSVYRYQNDLAELALDIIVNNIGTPIIDVGCTGSGDRRITRSPQNPNRITFDHGDEDQQTQGVFVIDCNSDLRLNLAGVITIEFLDTTPGALHYLIEMPFNIATQTPEGMVYQLPSDVGSGAILEASTPGVSFDPSVDPFGFGGFVECVQNGTRIEQVGTVRIEERQQGLLIIEEMEMEYVYDSGSAPAFAPWPGGQYEMAILAAQGFTSATSLPFDVTFDGLGGATFPLGTRTCQTNLATGDNPCEDL